MRTVKISDVTLREIGTVRAAALSFKERVEIARTLDRLHVDVIELPPIRDSKADVLSNKTIASVVTGARLSAAVGMTEESVAETWESVRAARDAELHIMIPASAVQMEYLCHKKAPAMVELAEKLVSKARYYTERVAFSAMDATRAEPEVLDQLLGAAIAAGAGSVTLCDSAGIMTAFEWSTFLKELMERVPALKNVELGVEVSDGLKMAVAGAAAAVDSGASLVKSSISPVGVTVTEDFAAYLKVKGEERGIACSLRTHELNRAAGQLKWLLQTERSSGSPFDAGVSQASGAVCLTAGDDIEQVVKVVRSLGYDLTEEDNAKVYEAFRRIAGKKHFVSSREVEAIVASTALQVPSTYHIVSYVITSGNTISAMANLTLERDGEKFTGACTGDGPIDAAFLAIEQIVGHHYELDDFQIQAVTEGREAMGSALVKLRSDGKLYSGNGLSTDVIGASIRAYISALNKIVYDSLS